MFCKYCYCCDSYRCIYYAQWSSADWITGCDAAEFERFNFQFQIYSGKHGVRLKPDCRTDLINQTGDKEREEKETEGFKTLKSKIKPELFDWRLRVTLGVTSTVRVSLPESLQVIMFEETGPEWLSEEVKTGVSTEFSLMSIRNVVNCYCAAQFLTSWLKRGYYRCRFIGMNPEQLLSLCVFVCRQPLSP